jgi:hypothetical protein
VDLTISYAPSVAPQGLLTLVLGATKIGGYRFAIPTVPAGNGNPVIPRPSPSTFSSLSLTVSFDPFVGATGIRC